MKLEPITIEIKNSGLTQNKKPYALVNEAFPKLKNAYVYRDRLKKREGLKLVGRLRRNLIGESLGTTIAAQLVYNFADVFTTLGITGEPDAQIEVGSITITIGAPDDATFNDNGDGTFAVTGAGVAAGSFVNYTTGEINLVLNAAAGGASITLDMDYFPMLSSMGIIEREVAGINDEISIIFDQKYAYVYGGSDFLEFIPGTEWDSTDSDFFWATNYRGIEPNDRLTFVTNFVPTVANPMRFTDGITWTDFAPIIGSRPSTENFPDSVGGAAYGPQILTNLPIIPGTIVITVGETVPSLVFRDTPQDGTLVSSGANTGTINYTTGSFTLSFNPALAAGNYPIQATYSFGSENLFQARILIPYYGRLCALNVYEGTSMGTARNVFQRCRFSQVGDPLQIDAWRSDTFGKGGFVDAPTNEEIIGAIFYKNTLIVFFEQSTWQLRYTGDYGIPFVFERISSDFGSESTFSSILFDQGVLAVGDRAIISSTGNNVERIDLDIPDKVFSFSNVENGPKRVQGIRDYQKELVFWSYSDGELNRKFPNNSLLYNYRNNTYAEFRNNVTCYGYLKSPGGITWDSQSVTWDDDVLWSDDVIENFPMVVCGNQQGFISFYGYPDTETIADSDINALDQETLAITAVDLTTTPIQLTIPNHNLETDEVIYIANMLFSDGINPVTTDLNLNFYIVQRINDNVIGILKWDFTNNIAINDFPFTPVNTSTYIGGGVLALFPLLDVLTKDFAPYEKEGVNAMISYIDLLTDAAPESAITIKTRVNSNWQGIVGNALIGNLNVEQSLSAYGAIAGITQATNALVATREVHSLLTGDSISFQSVLGMTQINGLNATITFVSTTSFTIDIDTTGFGAYTGGGTYVQTNFPFYIPDSNYAWHRFLCNSFGQYIALNFTYDMGLMNTLSTHQSLFVLNQYQMWMKRGGRTIF